MPAVLNVNHRSWTLTSTSQNVNFVNHRTHKDNEVLILLTPCLPPFYCRSCIYDVRQMTKSKEKLCLKMSSNFLFGQLYWFTQRHSWTGIWNTLRRELALQLNHFENVPLSVTPVSASFLPHMLLSEVCRCLIGSIIFAPSARNPEAINKPWLKCINNFD